MTETELRERLREMIATSGPPPPMDTAAMLDRAREARSRRRTIWAGIGAAAGVVTIAIGATVALSGGDRLVTPAGPSGPTVISLPGVAGTQVAPAAPPQGEDTKTVWPTGPDGTPQQDRTAGAGPRHEVGARLLDELVAVVPQGYTASQGPAGQLPNTAGPGDMNPSNDPWVRYHQAQFAERVDGVEVWEYLASLAVHQDQHVGRLFVEVHTPRNNLPTEPCELAVTLWGLGGDCELVDAGGKQVGVVVRAAGDRDDFDQWAAYRHPDGTVVFVAQAQKYRGATSGLPQPLFTVQQLAELATADRFHVE